MNRATNPYAGYRYPAEIISHAVWWYFRCTRSCRDSEELLAARGTLVTYKAIRSVLTPAARLVSQNYRSTYQLRSKAKSSSMPGRMNVPNPSIEATAPVGAGSHVKRWTSKAATVLAVKIKRRKSNLRLPWALEATLAP